MKKKKQVSLEIKYIFQFIFLQNKNQFFTFFSTEGHYIKVKNEWDTPMRFLRAIIIIVVVASVKERKNKIYRRLL